MIRLVLLSEIIAPYRIPVFNALARHADIDLHVIFLAESDPELRQWLIYKDEIRFSYEVLPSQRMRFGGHNILLNRGLKKALNRKSPHVVLCGGYNYLASWQARSWSFKQRIPFVLWVESTEKDQRRRYRAVESVKRRFMRGCCAFVVPGKSSFEYVRNYGIAGEDIFVAPNAVDTDLFARRAANIRQSATTHSQALRLPPHFFLFVGRLVPEKGVFDLLAAYGKLSAELRAKVGLVIAGEGTARAELTLRANDIVPGHVQFPGFVQREELSSYYALADALVFPSHTDPWGLVVNEAMACGLPVISSDAAGCTADLVKDGCNGRVVRAGDIGQLAYAMETLADNSDLRSEMGKRSREMILKYSPEACAAGIATAVQSCAMLHHEEQSA
jgi:1,2-diacylglycerol 3-alpha-glucosyltransferase